MRESKAREEVPEESQSREALEEELRAVKESAAAFAYAVSHDLEQRVRAVSGFGQLLQLNYGGQIDERFDRFLSRILASSAHLHAMLDGLLLISRIETRGGPMVETPLMEPLVSAKAGLEPQLESLSAQLELPGELPTLSVDPKQLTLVFEQLIENALKFRGEEPPVIRIEAGLDGEDVVVSVSDNGRGVDPHTLPNVFQIFVRGDPKGEGEGVGLTLVERIIKRHGGKIWVDATHSPGFRLLFSLPLRRDP